MKKSAGIVILYKDKMLACHPTGWKWHNSYSIPKGGIEEGESILDAALRECKEEVGISINSKQLDDKMYQIEYQSSNKKKGIYKIVYYWLCRIENLSEIGLKDEVVPKNQLQREEVDWAGFLDYKEANHRLSPVMKILTKHIEMSSNENTVFKVKGISEFVNEKYLTYKDLVDPKRETLEEVKERMKKDVILKVKHLLPYDWSTAEDYIKSVEDLSDDEKGVKFEVELKDGRVLNLYKTQKFYGYWEIYLDRKKKREDEIKNILYNELPNLEKYILAVKGHDWNYMYADDSRAYSSGQQGAENLAKLYANLTNSDKKKAYQEFLKVAPKNRKEVEFKMFNGR